MTMSVIVWWCYLMFYDEVMRKIYPKISVIRRRTKSQILNDSHLVLKSSLLNPLKPGVKLRTKM